MPIQFGGQLVSLPGVRTLVQSGALGTLAVGGVATPALVGSANDGKPKTPTVVASPAQLARLFNSGPLVDAGNAAFAEGAPQLVLSRVDPATQATYTFDDGSGNPSLVLTAASWGSLGNQIQAQITAGATADTEDITIKYLPTGYNVTSPDLGQAFSLQYTDSTAGAGAGAEVTISNALSAPTQSALATATTGGSIAASTTVYVVVTAVNASGQTIASNEESVTTGSTTSTNTVTASWGSVTGATKYYVYASDSTGTETYQAQSTSTSAVLASIATGGASPPISNSTGKNLSTTFTTAPTDGSEALDVPLNGASGTQYTTIGALVAYLSGQTGYTATLLGLGTISTQYLDTANGQAIQASAYTATAKLGAIVNWVNQNVTLVTASAATNATNAPATGSLVSLAGGSNGTAAASDWQSAIDALSGSDVQMVVPLTGSASTIAYCQTDITNWAAQGQQYAQGIYGLAWGATDSQLQQQAGSLGTGNAELVAPGYVGGNSAGVSTNFDGFYMAARYAGLVAAQISAATPTTNKTVHVSQLERTLAATEQQSLLASGVTCIVPRRKGGFKVLEDRTTNSASTNIYDTQGSVRRSVNVVRAALQDGLDADVGIASLGVATQHALIRRATEILTAQQQAGNIAGFSPVTNVTQSASNATAWLVDVDVTVEVPINHLLCTVNLSTGAVTSAA